MPGQFLRAQTATGTAAAMFTGRMVSAAVLGVSGEFQASAGDKSTTDASSVFLALVFDLLAGAKYTLPSGPGAVVGNWLNLVP